MSPRTYRPSVHPNNRWPDGTGLLIGATDIWSVTQFALLTMLGATNLNQFTWTITAVQNIFMVFRKAIFVLRVLVNQDKKFMDPSALLSSWFTRQTGFFCSEISPLSAVFCTYIQECWRKEFVIVLIHKVRPRALENWLYWNRLGLLGTHWFLQVKDVYSRLFVVE